MLKFALQYDSIAGFVHEFPEKIATKGLFLKTAKPAETGGRVGLLFKFKTDAETFTATGDITWIDDSELAASGKRGLVIKNIQLDAPSKQLFNQYLKAELAGPETVVATAPAPAPKAVRPAAAPAPAAPQPVYAAPRKSRWGLWLTLVLLVLGGAGFAAWYLEFGGKDIIANLGVEYRDGRVTRIDQVEGTFSMGLVNQRSSDWHVVVGPQTQWIGVRSLRELRVGDRIGLRYKAREGAYDARQVTVKERLVTGTVGGLVDKTKGLLRIEDSKIAGSFVELTSEFNDNAKALLAKLRPGDKVEAVYAVGQDGQNAVRNLVVTSREAAGRISEIDPAARTFTMEAADGELLSLTGTAQTAIAQADDWKAFGAQDTVRVRYSPEDGLVQELELVEKYVAPAPKPTPKPKPKPKPKPLPPVALRDILHSADAVVARFALDFNRRAAHEAPVLIENPRRIMLRIPDAKSEYRRSELFLSKGPLRTLRIEEQGGDLVLTFLVADGVTPRYSFETEGNRLIALIFKQ